MENKLLNFARSLPEHRMDRKKLHLAEDIVYITLAAVICGADTWEDICQFGRSKEDFLKQTLSLKNGIPSPDTFNRFFAVLSPDVFEANFISWVKEICNKNTGVIAIDGKAVRGSRKQGNKSAIHMVGAFAAANGLALGQVKTNQKSNEITAIPELLKVLDIEGCIVTIDAMGCQTKIAQKIIGKGADYILAVKDNQKELHTEIVDTFRFSPRDKMAVHEAVDAGHGRVETRVCTITDDLSLLSNTGKWQNVSRLVKIDSTRFLKASKETQQETRYYITSCKLTPEEIGAAIRSHWSIENQLHWQLDVSFGEDKSRKRDRNAAENYSVILRMALNIVKNEKTTKRSVKGKRLKAGWDNDYLLKLLNF
ncbi:DDE family transposase [Marinilabilia salmonicolor]|jgi:predicted transposase YbfD/YdcC|uniref:ISAs1 family transposase n=1 Tax=Marinilabilia salmonicolor TaxID=989 RepID=UPI000D057B10|nr:ISAs1 family transposase [Marinilabilia salmonicolor]PRY93845.1 DDE family transposase [Marinilabilia salmonicolor]